jgi:cytochrome oxidase assembly protein ShyY1
MADLHATGVAWRRVIIDGRYVHIKFGFVYSRLLSRMVLFNRNRHKM